MYLGLEIVIKTIIETGYETFNIYFFFESEPSNRLRVRIGTIQSKSDPDPDPS